MQEEKLKSTQNKTPEKMARLAWPKAKYGVVVAIIILGPKDLSLIHI